MPRPTNKTDLLALSQANYDKMMSLVAQMTPEQQVATYAFEYRDRCVRDTLGHLYHWHQMMATWYEVGMGGEKPAIPAPGYTFRDLPALNAEIWQQCQAFSLAETQAMLQSSHAQMQALIEQHSDEELFTKKHYPWTNTTSLGAYLVSATSSHYDWAMKWLRKHLKTSATA